jgi:hypothetical protein
MDINLDGLVSRSEFSFAIEQLNIKLSPYEEAELFKLFDNNGND